MFHLPPLGTRVQIRLPKSPAGHVHDQANMLTDGMDDAVHAVYECPVCETRLLGDRRCPDCHVSCRRLGPGGPCPHCDEPIVVAEHLPPEVLP